ncbi:MAG: MG2 domain-containing protein [Planctomycetota bacterium]|nr:MG2 domain-containing protein [Planctomycetota bacterium]
MGSSFNLRRWRGPVLGGALALALAAGLAPFNGQDKAPDLGGSDRYLAHISTDKPIYRPGETLYLRSVLLHAFKHTPLKGYQYGHVKVTNSRGSAVMESDFRIDDSAGGASWEIPKNMAGGEYTVKVSFPGSGHAPAERKFDIRAYRAPAHQEPARIRAQSLRPRRHRQRRAERHPRRGRRAQGRQGHGRGAHRRRRGVARRNQG